MFTVTRTTVELRGSARHSTENIGTSSHLFLTNPHKVEVSHFTVQAGSKGFSNLHKVTQYISGRVVSAWIKGLLFLVLYRHPKVAVIQTLNEPLRRPNTELGAKSRLLHWLQPLNVGFSSCGSVSKCPLYGSISCCVLLAVASYSRENAGFSTQTREREVRKQDL